MIKKKKKCGLTGTSLNAGLDRDLNFIVHPRYNAGTSGTQHDTDDFNADENDGYNDNDGFHADHNNGFHTDHSDHIDGFQADNTNENADDSDGTTPPPPTRHIYAAALFSVLELVIESVAAQLAVRGGLGGVVVQELGGLVGVVEL